MHLRKEHHRQKEVLLPVKYLAYLKNSREVRMTRQERAGKKIIGDNTPGEYRIGDNIPGEYICGKSKLYVGKANYGQPF